MDINLRFEPFDAPSIPHTFMAWERIQFCSPLHCSVWALLASPLKSSSKRMENSAEPVRATIPYSKMKVAAVLFVVPDHRINAARRTLQRRQPESGLARYCRKAWRTPNSVASLHLRSCLPEVLWTCAQGNPLPSGRPAAAQRASELCMHALRKTETTASDKSVRGSGGRSNLGDGTRPNG